MDWRFSDPSVIGDTAVLSGPSNIAGGAWGTNTGQSQAAFEVIGDAVPEPSTAALFTLASAAGLAFAHRRRCRA